MRTKWLYSLAFSALILSGCKKDVVLSAESFIKVMTTSTPYIARDVVELSDGSFLLSAVQSIDNFNASVNPATDLPSLLNKYDHSGDFLWQIELPENVRVLWHCRLMKNGNIVVVGFSGEHNSEYVGVVTLSQNGTILKRHAFFNSSRSLPSSYGDNSVDCMVLQNGNIALTMPHSMGSNIPLVPRLVILDSELNTVFDKRYQPNGIIPKQDMYQLYVQQDPNGDVMLSGRADESRNDTLGYTSFVLKLESNSYKPIAYNSFAGNNALTAPSNLTFQNANNAVWTSSGPSNPDTLLNYWFNLRNQEKFLIGRSISVLKMNADLQIDKTETIEGYLKNGFIRTIIGCKDGGYMMLGTCNINSNQLVPSDYRILLVKVRADLSLEWIEIPGTNGPAIGADIKETDLGYVISATHVPFGEFSQPIVFNTDKKGKIK
ncbi:MAG: hypothetical protein ACI9JN_001845 [Bacteroidia bacterium]|jgi:hypothetical protein